MTTQEFEFIQAKVKRLTELNTAIDDLRKFINQWKNVGPFKIKLVSAHGYSYQFDHLSETDVKDMIEHYLLFLKQSIAQLETELSTITICKKLTADDTDNPGPDPE